MEQNMKPVLCSIVGYLQKANWDYVFEWLIDWSIDWSTDWLIDWLASVQPSVDAVCALVRWSVLTSKRSRSPRTFVVAPNLVRGSSVTWAPAHALGSTPRGHRRYVPSQCHVFNDNENCNENYLTNDDI